VNIPALFAHSEAFFGERWDEETVIAYGMPNSL